MSLSRHHLYLAAAFLLVAALACNMPQADTGGTEQTTEAPPQTEEQPPDDEPAPSTVSAFVGSPSLDVSTLPILAVPVAGAEGGFCMETHDAPAISIVYVLNDAQRLCLYNFPTAPDSPDFTLTMTAPDGTSHTETFSYAEGDYGVEVIGATGGLSGAVMGDMGEGMPDSISVRISTVASVPAGEWMVSASASDGSFSVAPTPITIERYGDLVSVLNNPTGNPFELPPTIGHSGDTLDVIGVGFDPNTTLTVAFYLPDPALGETEFGTPRLAPMYVTTVTTDAEGGFQTAFAVGDDAPIGTYFTVAEPTIAPEMFVDPFTGRFSIE
jgi:hypothetical protein